MRYEFGYLDLAQGTGGWNLNSLYTWNSLGIPDRCRDWREDRRPPSRLTNLISYPAARLLRFVINWHAMACHGMPRHAMAGFLDSALITMAGRQAKRP